MIRNGMFHSVSEILGQTNDFFQILKLVPLATAIVSTDHILTKLITPVKLFKLALMLYVLQLSVSVKSLENVLGELIWVYAAELT